jgi:FRG domain
MVSDQYPGYVLPEYADVTGSLTGGRLSLRWRTNIDTIGETILERGTADGPSELSAHRESWAKFKEYVAALKGRRYLFRGQNQPWRLRTSFHRAGRADVGRFHNQDVPALHKHLSARTKHVFNLSNADENGAFFNLVQHHGYPTPLLDWTYSPYVAAFFAYRDISSQDAKDAAPEKCVRVLVFDQAEWREDFSQILMAAPATRHVPIAEFSAIENERMIPQQAASMVTTIDDIESYIREKETDGRQYLSAFDLPVQERNQVMQDLSFMGITAGSLFPGLDGACEELKGRNFEG